jgi:hypothetical protein
MLPQATASPGPFAQTPGLRHPESVQRVENLLRSMAEGVLQYNEVALWYQINIESEPYGSFAELNHIERM